MYNKVREIRKSQSLTGADLAVRTGIAKSDISKIERGRIYPHPSWRQRIADALNRTIKELFPEVANA